jgi:glutathione S-transferase
MKLYFSPGACSLAPHIVLREINAAFELAAVDTGKHVLSDGSDFYAINPKGQVPVLELDSGERLTEGPIISQYLADQAKAHGLLPASGTARYRVLEWASYVTSELHKTYTPLFNPDIDATAKAVLRKVLRKKYEWVDAQLAGKSYLTGDQFTIADAIYSSLRTGAGSSIWISPTCRIWLPSWIALPHGPLLKRHNARKNRLINFGSKVLRFDATPNHLCHTFTYKSHARKSLASRKPNSFAGSLSFSRRHSTKIRRPRL